MKILAIDFGTQRIGYAVSDESFTVAFARTSIRAIQEDKALENIATIIQEEHIGEIVIGVPLNEDNEETPMSMRARAFGEKLAALTKISVEFVDEGNSSEEALARIPLRKDRRDKDLINAFAAQVILERYIEEKRKKLTK